MITDEIKEAIKGNRREYRKNATNDCGRGDEKEKES